jgi:hypothetical protein
MTLAVVHTAGSTNDGSTHRDSTLGGTATDQQSSITYTNLIVRANDASDLKQVVRDYVTQHFFKYVKCITSWKKLVYHDPATNPNTYCAVVTKGVTRHPARTR